MAKLMYEDVVVGEFLSSKSIEVDEALALINFDEEAFISEQGFDDIDYNEFRVVY